MALEDHLREHPCHGVHENLSAAVRFAVNEVPNELGTSFSPCRSSAFHLQNIEKAERVGFEPTRRLNTAYAISNRAPSANSDTSPGRREFTLSVERRRGTS